MALVLQLFPHANSGLEFIINTFLLRFYCPAGSTAPFSCPPGRYGNAFGLVSPNCSGLCLPGFYCPGAATNSTYLACPPGTYGSTSGLTQRSCTSVCDSGNFLKQFIFYY